MKTKIYLLSTLVTLLVSCYPNDVIKEIKDLEFREYLIREFDANKDHKLTKDEVILITEVVIPYDVKSVQGIEYLENLEEYHENGGKMVSLNLSKNSKLQKVDCMNMRQLSNLQVPRNIETIVMTRTALKELKLKDMPFLSELYCIESSLETLEIDKCPCLTIINCNDNELTEIDLSKFPALKELYCNGNNLTVIDISKNPELKSLRCKKNKNLKEIICKKGQKIEGITHNVDYKYDIDKGIHIRYID
jgi:cell wall surface anchor family protein